MKIEKPESVGLSSERLKDFDKMLMENYIGPSKLSGTQTLVARKGSIVHFHSQGKRDLENKLKQQDETKTITFTDDT